MQNLFNFLSQIFLNQLSIWKRLIAGVLVGVLSACLLIVVDGALVSMQPVKDLQIDESVKTALQAGVDTGRATYEILTTELAVKDVNEAGVTICRGGANEECVFTFGKPLKEKFFKTHTASAEAIALHEVGHAVAYKRGLHSEWIVYLALFVMLTVMVTGLTCHLAGMLIIGGGFTALHVVLLKFPFKDLNTFQLSVILLSVVTVCGLTSVVSSMQWSKYPRLGGFALNPYAAVAAILAFASIAHLNNKLEAFSDLVAACQFQNVEPIRNALQALEFSDSSRYPPVMSWVFDPFHPNYQNRVDALARIESLESLAQQCRHIKDNSSTWTAASY